jgi:NifU-like protein involved in Fe-S cluster formation
MELYQKRIKALASDQRWYLEQSEGPLYAKSQNHNCGDTIKLYRYHDGLFFSGTMCLLCRASAHLLCDISNHFAKQGEALDHSKVVSWLKTFNGEAPHKSLEPLEVCREFRVRRQCIALPWQAYQQGEA